jgi:hypothetical protein
MFDSSLAYQCRTNSVAEWELYILLVGGSIPSSGTNFCSGRTTVVRAPDKHVTKVRLFLGAPPKFDSGLPTGAISQWQTTSPLSWIPESDSQSPHQFWRISSKGKSLGFYPRDVRSIRTFATKVCRISSSGLERGSTEAEASGSSPLSCTILAGLTQRTEYPGPNGRAAGLNPVSGTRLGASKGKRLRNPNPW